jgi:hypothetical protein
MGVLALVGLTLPVDTDPKTELITSIEFYRDEGSGQTLRGHTEFSDYDAAIDPKMFSLRDEPPRSVGNADRLSQVA